MSQGLKKKKKSSSSTTKQGGNSSSHSLTDFKSQTGLCQSYDVNCWNCVLHQNHPHLKSHSSKDSMNQFYVCIAFFKENKQTNRS